jgi:hypothetical protein
MRDVVSDLRRVADADWMVNAPYGAYTSGLMEDAADEIERSRGRVPTFTGEKLFMICVNWMSSDAIEGLSRDQLEAMADEIAAWFGKYQGPELAEE